MAKLHVRKGDTVLITTGSLEKGRGKKGKIIKVLPDDGKVVVEGVNLIKKHTKPRKAQDKGGIVERPAPIDSSNVMLVCPSCGKPTRIAHKAVMSESKKKEVFLRCCKQCGEIVESSKNTDAPTKSKKQKSDASAPKKTTKKKTEKAD